MSDAKIYRALVEDCKRNLMLRGSGTIDAGKHVHAVLRHRLKGVRDPGSRRSLRAKSVDAMVQHLRRAGFRVDASELNRCIAIHHVARLFGPQEAHRVPLKVLRRFCKTIKRVSKAEEWVFLPKVRKPAQRIWRAVVAGKLTPTAALEELDKLFGRKPRQPKPKSSAMQRVVEGLAKLSIEQRRRIFLALEKTLPKPDSVPLPQEKPGRPSLRAAPVPSPHRSFSTPPRLSGNYEAGSATAMPSTFSALSPRLPAEQSAPQTPHLAAR